jgi:hypothetical protein
VEEKAILKTFARADLRNWRKIHVGDVHATFA